MQQEMSNETRQAERRDSRKKNPRADADFVAPVQSRDPLLENDRCLEFHRNLQIPLKDHQAKRKPTKGSFKRGRQAAEEEF